MKILITGATGKVGRQLIPHLLSRPNLKGASLRAICHNRKIEGIETVTGTIADRDCVRAAMKDVSHVVHLATCKETPEDVMDVTVKGLFWLLEEFRVNSSSRQFIIIGGDAAVGHFFYDHGGPLTETSPHMAYPGCYALSKVLEEVMLFQYGIQYGSNVCCLRAPWIMEKDDFKYSLSFGDDVFGGPVWKDLVGPEQASEYLSTGTIPLLLDRNGRPLKRNFVHVEDLVSAIGLALDNPNARGRLFNICMDEPVDYGAVAQHLAKHYQLPSVEIPSNYYSNWMDNTAAKYALDWRPAYDLARLIDAAWQYRRAPDDARRIWYPG